MAGFSHSASSTHAVPCFRIFFLKAESCLPGRPEHMLFIRCSARGCLGRFHVLAILNSAAMNIGGQMSVCVSALNSSRYIPRRSIYPKELEGGIQRDSCTSMFMLTVPKRWKQGKPSAHRQRNR